MQAPKSLVSCASHTKHSQVTGAVAQQPDMEKKKSTRKHENGEVRNLSHVYIFYKYIIYILIHIYYMNI